MLATFWAPSPTLRPVLYLSLAQLALQPLFLGSVPLLAGVSHHRRDDQGDSILTHHLGTWRAAGGLRVGDSFPGRFLAHMTKMVKGLPLKGVGRNLRNPELRHLPVP